MLIIIVITGGRIIKNYSTSYEPRLTSHLFYFYVNHESESCSALSDSLQPHGLYSPRNSLGQNIGVGSLSLLQGIFPTQALNPDLLHCRQILYQLSHKGSPGYGILLLKKSWTKVSPVYVPPYSLALTRHYNSPKRLDLRV